MNLEYIKKNITPFELSYEPMVHNKVYNYYMAIPYGKKYLIWFTYYNNENICLLLEVNHKNNEILNYEKIVLCYDKLLLGTLIYGTIVVKNNIRYFAIENILYYCGNDVQKKNFGTKIEHLNTFFSKYINNYIYFSKQIILLFCMSSTNKDELIKNISNLSYNVFAICYRNINNNYSQIVPINKNIKEDFAVFTIYPDLKDDIYTLYIHGTNGLTEYQKAYIPDYKTSVMMNNYFRIIKENKNLDLLEESDDEEEFENINEDKFVYMNRCFNFKCVYNKKFKKWTPVKKTNEKKIANFSLIKSMTSNN
jgi:hypothetical protein